MPKNHIVEPQHVEILKQQLNIALENAFTGSYKMPKGQTTVIKFFKDGDLFEGSQEYF